MQKICCFLAVPLSLSEKRGLTAASYFDRQHGKGSPGGWGVPSQLLQNEVGSGAFVCSEGQPLELVAWEPEFNTWTPH